VNDVGWSQPSDPTALIIATIPGAPSAPFKSANTMTSITLEWEAPADDGATPIT
jgi:hypothetical protein